MKKIHIVTDSTADLTEEEILKYGIHVVPLTIQIDNDSYIDGVDLEPEEFLGLMENAKELPKSSQPATGVFKELYERLGEDGSEILSIHMTGGMSGTVRSAEIAAEMSKTKVTVIDSMFISHALSFQVLEAAKMAANGKDVEDIVTRIEQVRKQTTLYLAVDKLDNLIKGGRIGRSRGLIGSLLKIKPITTLQNGVLSPVAQVRSHRQVISHLFKVFTEETAGKIIRSVGISHANSMVMAEPLKKLIEDTGIKDVRITFTTPVISTHTGEGAIGFMYYFD